MAQQISLFSQYDLKLHLLNPGKTGVQEALILDMHYRSQWTGFQNAPVTGGLGINSKISERMGLACSFISDDYGVFTEQYIRLSYAYRIPLNSEDWKLSMGMAAACDIFAINRDKISMYEEDDEVLNKNHGKICVPDLGLGFYLYKEKYFSLGFSMLHLAENQVDIKSSQPQNPKSSLRRHYYFSADYMFRVRRNLELKPNVLLQFMDKVPLNVALGLKSVFREAFWAGLAYRTSNDMVFDTGFILNKRIVLAYAYDLSNAALHNPNANSHELCLAFILGNPDYENAYFWH
jgi:type IX secretion system PorP/SprF family membrane protein